MKHKADISQGTISFDGVPNATIRQMLKFQGFRWSPREQYWYRVRGSSWDFLQTLDKEIDKVNGIRRPDGNCWKCGSEQGFFRSYGAASPVYCDECEGHARSKTA